MLCTATGEQPWSRFKITIGEGYASHGNESNGGHYGYFKPYANTSNPSFGAYTHISGEDLHNYRYGWTDAVYFCQAMMFGDKYSFLYATGWSYDSAYTWKIVNETTGFESIGIRGIYEGTKFVYKPEFFYVDPTDMNTIVASYNNALGKTYTISIYQVPWTT